MVERKDILIAALKALLAGVETSAIGKILCTFIAELAGSDKGELQALSEAPSEKFDELLIQMELSTTNAALGAAGTEQIKKLVSNLIGLTDEKLKVLTDLTQQEFEGISKQLDRIDNTSMETHALVKQLVNREPRIKKEVLATLYDIDDGSDEAASAIKSFENDDDFGPAKAFIAELQEKSVIEEWDASDDSFIKREQELQEIISGGVFYECTRKLDTLISRDTPTSIDLGELSQIIRNDNDLAVYFYKSNTNAGWLTILNAAGEFNELANTEIANDIPLRMKAHYLIEVSKQQPKDVVDLISKLGVKDWFIQGILLDSLLQKPLEVVDEGVGLIKEYLEKAKHIEWFMAGGRSAEFMVAIAEEHADKAFEVAEVLLEIHKSDDEDSSFHDIKSKFDEDHYEDLVFKYFRKLWECYPFKAAKLLIDIFNNYLKKLADDDPDLVNSFRYCIERLDQIEERYYENIVKTIFQGICESGKVVVEQQPGKVEELFTYLEGLDGVVFERIEMYLRRFVPAGAQKERLDAIIGNVKFLDNSYWYEYRLLLRDKFEDISEEARKVFVDWVERQERDTDARKRIDSWIEEKENRKATEDDYRKLESGDKARELSLVCEQFSELYEKYKAESESTDEELEPQPRISELRRLSGKEGAPIDVEAMLKMKPIAAIDYICEPSKWEVVKTDEWSHRSPEEALSQVFEEVVKRRAEDYAGLELTQLQRLEPVFLQRYYNGICKSFRDGDIYEKVVLGILGKSDSIVKDNFTSPEHEWTFKLILDVIEAIFDSDELKKELVPKNSGLIWYIIEKLTSYDDKREEPSGERDPHNECINCAAGKAFTLVVKFGLFFKNSDKDAYDKTWSGKMKDAITHVIKNIKAPKVRSVLGVYFPQIYWLEEDLIEDSIDEIFDVSDDKMWRDIWGSYLSWSRAYKNVFQFLAAKGKYAHAISKIGTYGEGRGFAKSIDEGLVQHLMIAYFNDWIPWGDPLLDKFFEEAPAESRGKAAGFLKTGFSSIREEGNAANTKEKGKRVKLYWEKRIEAMNSNTRDDFKEAINFIGWVKDTLIEPTETLELTLKTLELTDGKLGKNRNEVRLVKGVCKIGKGNELLALKCMNKMMEGKPEWMSSSLYMGDLTNFLDHIVKLENETDDVTEIRKEARELVNAFGRRQIDELRPYYDKL